ncbi:MAG: xanthine dehydrogenase family protein molybdopterin-binding subunit [Polyangiales bacterium]
MSVGQPVRRIEGRNKVTGRVHYAADHRPDGVWHGVLVGAPFSAADGVSVDAAAALLVPGVERVLTWHDMPQLPKIDSVYVGVTRYPLQRDSVEFEGEAVALVLGQTLEAAEQGAAAVRVSGRQRPPVLPGQGELSPIDDPSLPLGAPHTRGDVEAGLASAQQRMAAHYTQPARHHNPMEPSATVAYWAGTTLVLYDAIQHTDAVPAVMAQALGIDPKDVCVVAPHTGGGFGCKGYVWPHQIFTAAAARIVQHPVKLVLTRAQMYSMVSHQPLIRQDIALGAAGSGRLEAIRHDVVTVAPITDPHSEPATEISKNLYACPSVATTQQLELTQVSRPGAMRAPVEGPGSWALESALDELAGSLAMDPLELRILNFAPVDPQHGKPWSSNKLLEAYEDGARLFGWRERAQRPKQDGHWRIGYGMATATMGNFRFPSDATVRLSPSGQVLIETSTNDIGTGVQTVLIQIAAQELDLPASHLAIRWGDSRLPIAGPVTGSSATMGTGAAVLLAARDAKAQVEQLGGSAQTREELLRSLQRLGREIVGRGHYALPGNIAFDADGNSTDFAMRTWGAIFVEVGVDPDFGLVRLRRAVGSYSAGRIINPRTARSQMIGGIIWGWGMATLEESAFEPVHARWLAKNLSNVALPVNADIPEDIQIHFVDEFDEHASPTGARGIGELGAVGVAAAVGSAVFDAVGVRIRDLPILPGKILAALS